MAITGLPGFIVMFIGGIGAPELLIILFIVVLMFGSKKLPDLAKGLGKGITEFKKATNGVYDDDEDKKKKDKEAAE